MEDLDARVDEDDRRVASLSRALAVTTSATATAVALSYVELNDTSYAAWTDYRNAPYAVALVALASLCACALYFYASLITSLLLTWIKDSSSGVKPHCCGCCKGDDDRCRVCRRVVSDH